jgi:hypothetical protein
MRRRADAGEQEPTLPREFGISHKTRHKYFKVPLTHETEYSFPAFPTPMNKAVAILLNGPIIF